MKLFSTEVELCQTFINDIPAEWTAYPEVANFDILLVRAADGFQIGVQAKLKFTLKLIEQAIEYSGSEVCSEGPDCRALLIPAGEERNHLGTICAYIGLTIIRCQRERERYSSSRHVFRPALPTINDSLSWYGQRDWHEMGPEKRCTLPAYIPDVKAGDRSPVQLTDWKIKALKICAILQIRGFVTRQDFNHIRIDHRRFLTPGALWMVRENGVFKRGPYMPPFERQHPEVFKQIVAEAPTWMAKDQQETKVLL